MPSSLEPVTQLETQALGTWLSCEEDHEAEKWRNVLAGQCGFRDKRDLMMEATSGGECLKHTVAG